jgi:Tol biopolymer transport system component/DNA-binding winged helix-turn-helix (wHTH) protein
MNFPAGIPAKAIIIARRMSTPFPRHYRFENVAVDLQNLRVTVGGEIRPLEPKSFRLLQFLIENRERVVTKAEIIEAVWQGTFVTDNALTRAVTQIRKVIGDDAKQPRFIETIPTVGYRFLAEVQAGAPQPPLLETGVRWPRLLAAGVLLATLAAGGWILWRRFATPRRMTLVHTEQFTSNSGLDINPSFSPDGNLVAYASDRTGSFEIWVRSMDPAGRELQLTNNGQRNLFPSFSTDGRTIVFSSLSLEGRGIYRVPSIGGPIQRLTTFGAEPVMSPDGKLIVFRSHILPSLDATGYYLPADSSLWIVPSEGGQPKQITSTSNPGGGQAFPSWTPDGKEIRFVNYLGYLGPTISVWTYRLSDGALKKRFEQPSALTLGSATFSHDGSRLYFLKSDVTGDIGIWQLRLNSSTLTPEGAPEELYAPTLGVPHDLSLSPDGTHLAFSAVLSESQLLVQRMAGDKAAESDPVPLTREVSFRYLDPRWSPDGKSIIYTGFPKSRSSQSWIGKLDGSSPVPVGPHSTEQDSPQILSDGKTAIYFDDGNPRLLKATSLSDGATRTVAEIPKTTDFPDLAPNETELVYNDYSGSVMQMWKQNLRTGARTQLTFGPDPMGFGRYSHDGKWLSVEIQHRGLTEIGLMPSSGGKIQSIWNEPGTWYVGSWSPDDDKILAAADPAKQVFVGRQERASSIHHQHNAP